MAGSPLRGPGSGAAVAAARSDGLDPVYAFDDAIKAYEHLARGAFGKIVIRVAN